MPAEQIIEIRESSARIPKLSSSVHNIGVEKPPFGSRFLTEQSDVWTQNAWDHVPPPDDQAEIIAHSLERQRIAPVPVEEKEKYNAKPAKHWDNFYKANADNFFRDRKWLHLEFPELVAVAEKDAGDVVVCEVGCGAGNTAFPLLLENKNPKLVLHAFDYSSHAVKLVQTNPLYHDPPFGSIQAAVWDLATEVSLPPGVIPESVDIVVLVFVLSALHPDEWERAVCNLYRMLKPGGVVLLRDYGRYDLTQLRFKSGRLLENNFYIRGDKTRVYFFELDELALIFTGMRASLAQKTSKTVEMMDESQESPSDGSESPMPEFENLHHLQLDPSQAHSTPHPDVVIHPNLPKPLTMHLPHPLFVMDQLGVDRRLLVNRKRQLKMYRVWMQGRFKKQGPNESRTL